MVDDHDVGSNNADGNHKTTHRAVEAYKDIVPGPLQTAYTVAGVRFI
jgi:hypothetical protein